MKTLMKVVGVVSLLAFLASPSFAAEGKAVGKVLSISEFEALPENNGAHFKMIQRRYEDYRKGRWVPASTLTTEHLR
jgi:hypothetical protein